MFTFTELSLLSVLSNIQSVCSSYFSSALAIFSVVQLLLHHFQDSNSRNIRTSPAENNGYNGSWRSAGTRCDQDSFSQRQILFWWKDTSDFFKWKWVVFSVISNGQQAVDKLALLLVVDNLTTNHVSLAGSKLFPSNILLIYLLNHQFHIHLLKKSYATSPDWDSYGIKSCKTKFFLFFSN